jgi:hypothetical protein
MRTRQGVICALIALLAGCATIQPIQGAAAAADSIQHQVERNYTIGVPQSVFVGQPMVRVKDYYTRQVGGIVRPDRAFTLKLPPFLKMEIPAGEAMRVVGTTDRDGTRYRLLQIQRPEASFLRFLLHPDGSFKGTALNAAGARMGFGYTPDPADVKVLPDQDLEVVAGRGMTNFELVYGGTTGDAIQVMYREYTAEDLARPAFSQQLVYSLATRSIRFRDIQIEVASADNEAIHYTVLADGQ